MTHAGGNIILGIAVGALFETKAVIALFGAPVPLSQLIAYSKFQNALTPATVVFNHLPFVIGFAPKDIGKPTGWTKYLHRLAIRVWLLLTHFRVIQVHVISRVINHYTILLTYIKAKATPHILLIQAHRLGWAKNGNKIQMGRIKARGEYRHIHQVL